MLTSVVPATIAALAVVGIAATKPQRIWVLLIGSSIVTSGLMPLGYTIVDEYFLALILSGALSFLAVRPKSLAVRKDPDTVSRIHWILFAAMAVYFLIESIRGFAYFLELRKLRWVAFYMMIGLVAIVLRLNSFAVPSRREVLRTVLIGTLLYLTAFLISGVAADLYGLYTDIGSMTGRWALQTTWWGSTAYTMLPVVLAMPAIIISLRDESKRYRRLAWGTLLAVLLTALYYDSRVAVITMLGSLLFGLPLGLKRTVVVMFLFTVLLYLSLRVFLPEYQGDVEFFVSEYLGSGSAAWHMGAGKDVDRWIHAQVAFGSIGGNWITLLFGHGTRLSGRVISPEVAALYELYLPERRQRLQEDESTEAFTALVVETGLVGVALVFANLMMVVWRIMRRGSRNSRTVVLWAVTALSVWLFVINILDVVLFYLMLAPSGPLLWMACEPCKVPSRRYVP
jgi:hypothetical protein